MKTVFLGRPASVHPRLRPFGLGALVLLMLSLCFTTPAQAQQRKRIGVFISGYDASVWRQSGAPEDWKRLGLVDEVVLFDEGINAAVASLSSLDLRLETDRATFFEGLNRLVADVGQILVQGNLSSLGTLGLDPNADLIFVGHSLGGHVARALGSSVEHYGMKVKKADGSLVKLWPRVAVITIGTPHQGWRVVGVDEVKRRELINKLIDTVEEPLPYQHAGAEAGAFLYGSLDRVKELRSTVGSLQNEVNYRLGQTSVLPLESFLSPTGLLPRSVVSLPSPSNYLSLYGAEKNNGIVRFSGELFEESGQLGNEAKPYAEFEQLKFYSRSNRDLWNGTAAGYYAHAYKYPIAAPYYVRKGSQAKKRANMWKDALNALKGIDDTWAQVIDSYATERRIGYRSVRRCQDEPDYAPLKGGDDGPYPREVTALLEKAGAGVQQQARALLALRTCAPGEDPYYRVPYTYYVTVEAKNDGVMSPQYGVWRKGDSYNDKRTLADGRVGNRYYDDLGVDGGYNHFELRRTVRAYGKEDDSGRKLGVTFRRGQDTPQIDDLEEWFRKIFRN